MFFVFKKCGLHTYKTSRKGEGMPKLQMSSDTEVYILGNITFSH